MTFKVSFAFIMLVCIVQISSAQPQSRTLQELTADTSGWALVKNLCKSAKNQISILPVSKARAEKALVEAQVTTRSAMGAVIYYTGGLLIDHGWLRILGSGSEKLNRELMQWNQNKTFIDLGERAGFLLIGDDAAGGFYAINGGALGNDLGNVYYLAPETLQWESLKRGYTDFLDFCLNADIEGFYKNLRWSTWKTDVSKLSGNQVFNFYPYLWSKEGKDINKTSLKPVPADEQYIFNMESRKQLAIK